MEFSIEALLNTKISTLGHNNSPLTSIYYDCDCEFNCGAFCACKYCHLEEEDFIEVGSFNSDEIDVHIFMYQWIDGDSYHQNITEVKTIIIQFNGRILIYKSDITECEDHDDELYLFTDREMIYCGLITEYSDIESILRSKNIIRLRYSNDEKVGKFLLSTSTKSARN